MARGNDGFENLKLFFMSIRGLKAGEKAHITQSQPDPNEKGKYLNKDSNKETKVSLKDIYSVSGDLVKIETKTREFADGVNEEIRLWLKDESAGEIYILSCGLNMIGRSLINLLASVDGLIGTLTIKVYNNSSTGMAGIYVENNGEKLSWKFDYAVEKEVNGVKLPSLKSMVTGVPKKSKDAAGKVVEKIENDYFTLNEFMLKVFREEIGLKVDKSKGPKQTETVSEPSAVAVEGDDLPF